MKLTQLAAWLFFDSRDPYRAAQDFVRRENAKGLFRTVKVLVHDFDDPAPLLDYRPGDDEPDFANLAYQLKTRWLTSPSMHYVVLATKRCRQEYGGCYGGDQLRDVDHDLYLAQRFLALPDELKCRFVPAERIQEHLPRLPDALLHLNRETVLWECGGRYSEPLLRQKHEAFKSFHYQLF